MSTTTTTAVYVVPTVEAYRAATPEDKRAMRREADVEVNRLVDSIAEEGADLVAIQSAVKAIRGTVATWSTESKKVEVDWTEARAIRGASLILAGLAVLNGSVRPDGMPDEAPVDLIEWDNEAITVWADHKVAAKLATESVRKGTKRDLSGPIETVFATAKSGTSWTFSELAHAVEAIIGGTVSSGAVHNNVRDNAESYGVTYTATSAKGAAHCTKR